MKLPTIIAVGVLCTGLAVSAHAANNILFVLDSSNSMWGQVEGTAKIETAKTALASLMSDLPPDTNMGLMVYGHRDKASCEDVELVLPVGKADAGAVQAALAKLKPTGKTPIAFALEQTSDAFANKDEPNSIVLVSDGIETCEGDPCSVAEKLAAANINVRVHVVGFDISDKDRAALECIAEKGKGKYFAANSTKGFSDAVNDAVVEVAQASPPPAPAPAEPQRALFFEDEFEGEDVAPNWTVLNPNPDAYIVEDGNLLLVNAGAYGFRQANTPNIIKLNQDMPKGDWDLTANVRLELQTGRDNFWFGLYNDDKNYMGIQFWTSIGYCSEIVTRLEKAANGDMTQFDARAAGSTSCGNGVGDQDKLIEIAKDKGIVVTLAKRGRKYTASVTIPGLEADGKDRTVTTEALTSLRLPGVPALAVGQWEGVKGETLAYVERVEIVSVSE